MASRLSLRLCTIIVDNVFESLKFATAGGLGLSRRALVTAVSSARSLHLMTIKRPDPPSDALTFFKVLDQYTNMGVSMIHTSFSLAELLTLSSFHLTSTTIKFTLETAEECVRIFDGLFGETDTSKALAAVIQLFYQELQGQDDALGLTKRFGQIYALGQVTKSMTAYCCLQFLNRKRWQASIKLHTVVEGKIKRQKGEYDPEAKVDPNEIFNFGVKANEALIRSATWGHKTRRRRSMEIFTVPKAFVLSQLETKQEDVFTSRPNRRRCLSGPGNNSWAPPEPEKELPVIKITPPPMDPKERGHRLVKMGNRFVKFAFAAYGAHFLKIMGMASKKDAIVEDFDEHHNHLAFASHTGISTEHIVTSSYRSPDTLFDPTLLAPVHYVALDHSTKSIVVCLRGTLGLSDIITDIKAHYVHYKYGRGLEGYAHAGIFHCAQVISTSAIKDSVIASLKENPGYKVILTGHSLGGGCAAILALLWSRPIYDNDEPVEFITNEALGFPRASIHCYCYGCPALMSAELSKASKELVTCFVFRNDIVCRLSLGLVRDFRNVTINLCTEKGVAETVISKALGIFKDSIVGNSNDGADDLWYWALLKTLRADMRAEKLYPPGRVYWINSPQTDVQAVGGKMFQVRLHEVDDVEIAFSEIAFSKSMFTDHSPHHYEGSLELLAKAVDKS
ncbi:hypothetical protein EDD86DRAFT_200197 [Gorgonomyces haynaldii]|nr:hypothetical protein EDD86DRAFT_200197 [Gorgonomyces haynaldii]